MKIAHTGCDRRGGPHHAAGTRGPGFPGGRAGAAGVGQIRGQLHPLAGPRLAGTDARSGRLCRLPIALFSAGAGRSREWGERAAAEGAVVVDNSSAWRMDPAVPLVVPEVNAAALHERPRGIVANPNCATIQLVLPLAALHQAAGLRRVLVTTFQSVSGAGQKGVAALTAELAGREVADTPFTGPSPAT